MWHVPECEPRSFSDPNNKPLPGFQWWATQEGSAALTRDWYFIINTSICTLFLHFVFYDSFSEALTDLHLHLFSSDLTTASWPDYFTLSAALITVSSYWHSSTSPHLHTQMRKKTPGCIIQQKVGKKADVDKLNGSTVNVAHEHQHLYVLILCMCLCTMHWRLYLDL